MIVHLQSVRGSLKWASCTHFHVCCRPDFSHAFFSQFLQGCCGDKLAGLALQLAPGTKRVPAQKSGFLSGHSSGARCLPRSPLPSVKLQRGPVAPFTSPRSSAARGTCSNSDKTPPGLHQHQSLLTHLKEPFQAPRNNQQKSACKIKRARSTAQQISLWKLLRDSLLTNLNRAASPEPKQVASKNC